MNKNMREKVRAGYNQGSYTETYRNRDFLDPFESLVFRKFVSLLPCNGNILDFGSGPGVPYDLHLVGKGFSVTGIDISEKHIEMSTRNVPAAKYILGDFLTQDFPTEEFDAVVSLYSLFHIQREHHASILRKISAILKPSGHLLITVGTKDVAYKERPAFCGAEMAWSYFDGETNLKLLSDSGFDIAGTWNESDYGSDENHLWVLARKIS